MTEHSAVKDALRDLDVEVIGAQYPDAYLYVGSGDHCVLLCEKDTPKWRNSVGLTPDNARKLAAALIRMADQSERVTPPDGTRKCKHRVTVGEFCAACDMYDEPASITPPGGPDA